MPSPAKAWPALLHLLLAQPDRVIEHASAYAALAADEGADAWAGLNRRLRLQFACGCCAVTAAVLAGVALMLWATLPALANQRVWLLVAVPLIPALAALWAGWTHHREADTVSFARLREQAGLDAAALHHWRDGDAPTR